MRAILIGVNGVREIHIPSDGRALQKIKDTIGCEVLASGGIPAKRHLAWIDDCGLLQDLEGVQGNYVDWLPPHSHFLAGKIVIVGTTEDWNSETGMAPATLTVEQVKNMVRTGKCYYEEDQ